MRLKDISNENLPRERLKQLGPKALSNAELLAIILKSGTKEANVIDISNKILSDFGFENLPFCTLTELQSIKGIGFAKACQIIALFELFKRQQPQNADNKSQLKITCAEDVFKRYNKSYSPEKKEHFLAIYLDSKNSIIKEDIVTIGILNQTLIHPREVFKGAIKNSANSVIIMHNHPSGDPAPSQEDVKTTKLLGEAGEIIGISLLDHVIIGNGYFSFKENSML